jgi:hypothetical protein
MQQRSSVQTRSPAGGQNSKFSPANHEPAGTHGGHGQDTRHMHRHTLRAYKYSVHVGAAPHSHHCDPPTQATLHACDWALPPNPPTDEIFRRQAQWSCALPASRLYALATDPMDPPVMQASESNNTPVKIVSAAGANPVHQRIKVHQQQAAHDQMCTMPARHSRRSLHTPKMLLRTTQARCNAPSKSTTCQGISRSLAARMEGEGVQATGKTKTISTRDNQPHASKRVRKATTAIQDLCSTE